MVLELQGAVAEQQEAAVAAPLDVQVRLGRPGPAIGRVSQLYRQVGSTKKPNCIDIAGASNASLIPRMPADGPMG